MVNILFIYIAFERMGGYTYVRYLKNTKNFEIATTDI